MADGSEGKYDIHHDNVLWSELIPGMFSALPVQDEEIRVLMDFDKWIM